MFTTRDPSGYREALDGVQYKTLAWGVRTSLSEFHLDQGAVIPVHDHPHEQTGYLVSGRLEFDIEGERQIAEPGDSWSLAGGVRHGVHVLEDSVVIEVFSPVREEYL